MQTAAISKYNDPTTPEASNQIVRKGMTKSGKTAGKEDSALRTACNEFEGMLLGILLKEGMKPGAMAEEQETGANIMQEYAAEQTARNLGSSGSFGIGEILYRQLSQNGVAEND